MFDAVLIANRGEIACRIARTLRRMSVGVLAVHSEADRSSRHVLEADAATLIGPAPVADSYLQIDRIVAAAIDLGADAIHPGYGLLSESAVFSEACEAAGLVFIGPTADQIRLFGAKHRARAAAVANGLPLVAGTDLLANADEAVAAAQRIGLPVMLKASAGGGGIGMARCDSLDEVRVAFESVARTAQAGFGDAALYLERMIVAARHVEVQIFGDGHGTVATLGARDCSLQRRNQKVIEETPPPGLPDSLVEAMVDQSSALAESVEYRSAGTVEFIVDAQSGEHSFLEVNTRLQVEHGVTEATHGIDLVEWMVRLAAGEPISVLTAAPIATGAAMQARIYAEDPTAAHRPCTGMITGLSVPDDVRWDSWIDVGTEITPFYDPLLGKLIVTAETREAAVASMATALDQVQLGGVGTNLDELRSAVADERFVTGAVSTSLLSTVVVETPTLAVEHGGTLTTIQDLPGRTGLWNVGVPPSGPMDDWSFALLNGLVGNEPGAPALEITMTGPTLRFGGDALIALGGAELDADLDGEPVAWWTAVQVAAGSVLRLGSVDGPGSRSYLAIAGGFDVPEHLGSASTFVLGGFGGHAGRALRPGDVLRWHRGGDAAMVGASVPVEHRPELTHTWEVGVLAGPHGAPDFFTRGDIDMLYGTEWEVHFHSDRTGVRLLGPAPTWARPDGGEAGLHPSNIHDNAYAIGTVDFTGDMPIVLGRDGPSLGGFVCPATVATSEFWKVGQAAAGDRIRFVPLDFDSANGRSQVTSDSTRAAPTRSAPEDPVMHRVAGTASTPEVVYRRDGDANVLVEYGPNELDLANRLRVGALMDRLAVEPIDGMAELVPGVRSLQVGFDARVTDPDRVVASLLEAAADLPPVEDLEVPSRIVHLPLSWDDPATRVATERYMQTVRPDAPWCPWNLEFIRRINGLDSVDDVHRIVFDASYLVLGLGDVYLGAPLATPIDPTHRLVTTKYNPARTWTAENSVGIGGAYLCIYGMEGPGGYQFVGRTIQVWNRWRSTPEFDQPWLLRFFDQIRWYPVDADELMRLRADFPVGRAPIRIEDTTFSVADHLADLAANAPQIEAFTARRDAAFAAERDRWAAAGLEIAASAPPAAVASGDVSVPLGMTAVRSPLAGVVVRLLVESGDRVAAQDPVAIVESMKTETTVGSPIDGIVVEAVTTPGAVVAAGSALVIIDPDPDGQHATPVSDQREERP